MERLLLAFRSSPRLFLPRSSREYLYNILLFFHNFQISHFYRRIYKIKNLITWKILTSKQVLRNGAPSNIWWMDIGRASQPVSLKNRLLPLSFSSSPSLTGRVIKKGPGLRDSASVSASIVAFVRCVPLNS